MYLLLAEPGEGRSCCLLSSSVCPCALPAGARAPPATPQWRRSEHPGDDSTSPARKAQVSMHAWPTLDAIILTTCVLCVFQPTTDSSGRRRQPGAQSGLHLVLVRGWIRVHPLPPRNAGPLTQGLMEGCALCLGACLYGPLFVFQFFTLPPPPLPMSWHLPGGVTATRVMGLTPQGVYQLPRPYLQGT